MGEYNESYDHVISLDISEFMISNERRICEYERWKERITLSK